MTTKKINKSPKTFILDTNVILHDASSINNFEENDVLIPLPVIEELDHFKRGSQVINLNAREFARTLDSLTGTAIFNGGVSIGKGKGKVKIAISRGLSAEIREIFREDTPDHRILSIALEQHKKSKENSIVLVTKDVNLRMKAKALGILSEDYTTDRINNVEELFGGKEIVENFDDDIIIKFFQMPFEVPADEIIKKLKGEILPNKYYILGMKAALCLPILIKIKKHLKKLIKI